jgi:hypothetical protein
MIIFLVFGTFAFVLAIILSLCLTSYLYFCSEVRKFRHIPGPNPSWPLGNAGLLRVNNKPITFLQAYDALAKEYGDVFLFFMGCKAFVVTVSTVPTLNTQNIMDSEFGLTGHHRVHCTY